MAFKRTWRYLLGAGVFILAIVSVMSYLWGDLLICEFQSDIADTLLWAEAINKSGSLVDASHYYPYVIPFGGQLLMVPFFSIFGFSLTTLRLGMTVFFALLSAALVMFFYRVVFRKLPASLFSAGCLLMLFENNKKLREIMYAHVIHYSLAVLLALVLLIALSYLWDKSGSRKSRICAFIAIAVSCFFCAANGMTIAAFTLFPCAVAFLIERLVNVCILKQKNDRRKTDICLCLAVAVSALAGLIVYILISRRIEVPYGDMQLKLEPASEWLKNIRNTVANWYKYLFVPELYADTAPTDEIVSIYGRVLGIVQGLFLVLSSVVLFVLTLRRYRHLESAVQRVTVLSFWVTAALTLVLCVFTPFNEANWRMVPMLAAMFLCYAVLLRNMFAAARPMRCIAAVLSVFLAFSAINAGVGVLCAERDDSHIFGEDTYISVLREHGLTNGYSNAYSICSTTRLFTDGEINMHFMGITDEGFHPVMYQNWAENFTPIEDSRYFMLVLDYEKYRAPEGYIEFYEGTAFYPLYRSVDDRFAKYAIYVFDHYPLSDTAYINFSFESFSMKEYFQNKAGGLAS